MSNTMQVVDLENYDKDLTALFKDFHWNFIPDAIREGSMGNVLVDNLDKPQAGILTIPEFKISFLGGDVKNLAIRDYINELPFLSMLMFASEGWPEILKDIHPKKWIVMPRFGFSNDNLNVVHLRELQAQLSEEFRIEKIDLVLAQRVLDMAKEKDKLTREQLFGYSSAEDFIERGLGYVAFEGNELVSIAAAGASCKKGIEIQVDTRKEYRRRGLATALSAALIIDCLEEGIVPNWDAATEESADLAKKLGYTPKGESLVYVFTKFQFLVRLRTFLRKRRSKGIIEP